MDEETVTDTDGNVYQTVRIGNQVWAVENLKTTKYNDGTPIPSVTPRAQWEDRGEPAYCWYDNDIANKDRYGALYNWHAVETGRLSPRGWHVPTLAEWAGLQDYLIADGCDWDGTKDGSKIAKALAAKTDWRTDSDPDSDPDSDSSTIGNDLSKNNRSGFSALPGGRRNYDGHFGRLGVDGYWWSATERGASDAFRCYLYSGRGCIYLGFNEKSCGISVRLLRD